MAVAKGQYNVILAIILFLNWIATILTFGNSMFQSATANFQNTPRNPFFPFVGEVDVTTYFYWWGYQNTVYGQVTWDQEFNVQQNPAKSHDKCWNVGGWFIMCTVFAFLALLLSIFMLFTRAIGRNTLLPFIKHRQHAAQIEVYSAIFSTFWIGLAIVIQCFGCMLWEWIEENTYYTVFPTNIIFVWIAWGGMFWAISALRSIRNDEPTTGRPESVPMKKAEPAQVYTPYMPTGPGPKTNVPYSSTNPSYQAPESTVNALPLPPRPAASGSPPRKASTEEDRVNELPLPPRPGQKPKKEAPKKAAPTPPAKKGGPKPPPRRV